MSRFRTKAKNLARWFWANCRWLMKPRLAWATGLAVVIALFIAVYMKSDPAFRWAGLALQVIGILTVAWDIRNTRKQFGQPGTFALVTEWLRQRPRLKAPVNIAVGAAVLGISTGRARVSAWHDISPDADLPSRLAAIEANLKQLKDQLGKFEEAAESQFEKQHSALQQEQQVRADADGATRKMLEVSATEGLSASVAGVMCLLVGVIMSTGSVELACFVKWVMATISA